jgi:hypothetical protein
MVVSSTSMKVAIATRTAMIQGFASPYSPLVAAFGIGQDPGHGRTVTVGTTDMPGPNSRSGR